MAEETSAAQSIATAIATRGPKTDPPWCRVKATPVPMIRITRKINPGKELLVFIVVPF
jgi:hypothetical protein